MLGKIIQIDQNPVLIKFSQTFCGKIICLIVFSFPLMFLTFKSWMWIVLAIALFVFFPQKRSQLLYILNFCFWIFSPYFYWEWLASVYKDSALDEALLDSFLFRFVVIILSVIMFWISINFFKKKNIRHYAIFCFSFLSLFLTYIVADILPKGIIYASICTGLLLLGRFFWYLLYAAMDQSEQKNIFLHIFYMQPFWGHGSLMPIPGGLEELKKAETQGEEEYSVCRLKAIKLIYWSAVSYLFLMFLNQVLVGFPNFRQDILRPPSGLNIEFIFRPLPTLDILDRSSCIGCRPSDIIGKKLLPAKNGTEYFGRIIGEFLYVFNSAFVLLFIWPAVPVAIARMSGYRIKRSMYKPFQAKNITDFFGRLAYYYRQIIIKIFFIPAYSILNFIQSSKIKVSLALIFSIMGCGLIYRFFLRVQLETIFLKQTHFGEIVERLTYFVPLYLLIIISIIFSELNRRFIKTRMPKVLRFAGYLLILYFGFTSAFGLKPLPLTGFLSHLRLLFVPYFLFSDGRAEHDVY